MARLTPEVVVATAVELADAEGLAAVTVRRLAERLEVTPMALYRHVASKDDLLNRMADRLYAELDVREVEGDWWDAIARLARSWRKLVLARPWAAALLVRQSGGPSQTAVDNAVHKALRRAGFTGAETRELHDQLSTMVIALVALERAGQRNRAAFERGLELLHAGLEARRRQPRA